MDEPTVTSQVDEADASTEKSDLNEVLDSAFSSEVEKPMEVDDVVVDNEPSTSAEPEVTVDVLESTEKSVDPPSEPEQDDAGKTDVSMSELPSDDLPEESVEQIIFDKADSVLDESLNETAPSEAVDSLDFTERSINISQLNVEHHDDDSNDAFNALKESETENPLQEPKEELEEPKEEVEEPKEPEAEAGASAESIEDPDDPDITDITDVEPATETLETETVTPMETDDTINEIEEDAINEDTINEGDDEPVEKADESTAAADDDSADESREIGTETADFDNLMNADDSDMGPPADVEKPQSEDIEEIPDDDDDVTTETTTEGEGIDENVCLLGDETEITEADKEAASQAEDATEDEETESVAADQETSGEPGGEEPSDDVVDVDAESAEKETEEPEPVEVEDEEEEPVEEDQTVPLKENEIREISDEVTEELSCLNCENSAKCLYRLLEESGEIKYLCTFNCVKEHREDNPDKYTFTQKKVKITEVPPAEHPCSKCDETKSCKYSYRITVTTTVTKDPPAPVEGEELPEEPPAAITETVQTIETRYLCEEACLKEFIGDNTEKYVVKEVKRRSGRVREAPKRLQVEEQQEVPKIVARSDADVEAARLDRDVSFIRRCGQCFDVVNFNGKTIQWETFDFCNEKCLGAYQSLIGAACVHCNEVVPVAAIGKLCVRFGADIKQFCTTQCLNDFKKNHQPCALCSKNLKKDYDENDENNVIVKRGNNNFCDEQCAKRYEDLINPKKRQPPYLCSVCNIKKSPKIHVLLDGNVHRFCSTPCFSAFKFVNNVVPDQCDMCIKHFERKSNDSHTIYQGTDPKIFCSRECMSFYITKTRSIWQCNWCKVSKYSFDMIQINHGSKKMCSLNCMSLFEVSTNALTNKRSKCDHCKIQKQPQYHLSMSDASIRNFCTYQCVLGFQSQFSRLKAAGEMPSVIPAGTAKRIMPASQQQLPTQTKQPVISLVQSLNTRRGVRLPYNPTRRSGSPIPVPELTVQLERLSDLPARVKVSSLSSLKGGPSWTAISSSSSSSSVRVENKTQIVTIPPLPKQVGNKSTMCKAITLNKAINCVPQTAEVECQTEDWLEQRVVVPVPIPIYVPQPMYMYNMPTIVPVPIPIPIPVPVFVPTTRNSASGIMKEIKKIQEKMPTDPYEAELLMMAEMVAGDKKREETDSDSDENNDMEYNDGIENNSSFNEDLVQMAFKMASGNDFDDPPVDLENEMTANTISQSSNAYGDEMDPHSLHHHQLLLLQQQRDAAAAMQNRGRKRIQPPAPVKQTNSRNSAPNKRIKREMEVMQPEMPREPTEKPDANMCLKYTFGVNAWKQWVATKNADFEKSSIRRKPIKSEILQLTADELNYSLCMFVKEVRKPNGSEYAPDTIYYLVLGIQQYLYENGRIDNIFTDRYYEQFTDCLDEVAKKFSVLYNDSQYIVTRVEEEHLWECKQLGAHSPHVLLSTLMFFNTKHFNLVTVDEHMELSFSHIMKHWKRNPNQPGAAKVPGSRNVLLRFYPPQSSLEANSRKKKVYEQQENEENPLRCPVKLYEFYLSKCPESVKTRNDVFYLQPERSCVPDSPVWYSTQPLSREALSKMLHRVKMVKEINIALLTS